MFLTFGILAALLLAYKSTLIKPTENEDEEPTPLEAGKSAKVCISINSPSIKEG